MAEKDYKAAIAKWVRSKIALAQAEGNLTAHHVLDRTSDKCATAVKQWQQYRKELAAAIKALEEL